MRLNAFLHQLDNNLDSFKLTLEIIAITFIDKMLTEMSTL